MRRGIVLAQATMMMLATSLAWAQVKAPDAATLAKYDKNKNGRLDADEVTAMQAAEKAAAATPTV